MPGVVVGVGINASDDVSAARFREKYGLDGEFLIYVGRIDEAKNVHELLDFFVRFEEDYGRDLKLVLMGKAHFLLPQHAGISFRWDSSLSRINLMRCKRRLCSSSPHSTKAYLWLSWKRGK